MTDSIRVGGILTSRAVVSALTTISRVAHSYVPAAVAPMTREEAMSAVADNLAHAEAVVEYFTQGEPPFDWRDVPVLENGATIRWTEERGWHVDGAPASELGEHINAALRFCHPYHVGSRVFDNRQRRGLQSILWGEADVLRVLPQYEGGYSYFVERDAPPAWTDPRTWWPSRATIASRYTR